MLLSVCLPTFQRKEFARVSVRFWLDQLPPFTDRVELIVADNGSTDGTVELLRPWQNEGALRLIERAKNIGFNRSVHDLVARQAAGEFVWVCGDDDFLNAGRLGEIVALIEANRAQDHFYLNTQFIPNDRAADLQHEDPRQSPHIKKSRRPLSHQPMARTQEIVGLDGEDFSGVYSSIWRRERALEALSGEFLTGAPFASLEATLPYAVYIARHRLNAPCYYIGEPALTISHTVSWAKYASLFRLKILPELYDLYEENGVPSPTLRQARSDLLDHWPLAWADLRRRRDVARQGNFRFTPYLRARWKEPRFWKELWRAFWCDFLP